MTDLVFGVTIKADGTGLVGQSRTGVAAMTDLRKSAEATGDSFKRAGSAVDDASRKVESGARRMKAANDDAAASANRHAFAVKNAGQQVGDFGLQVASGQDPARAFSQQIGQLGYAMSEMGGVAGKVGGFLAGPWGIALTIAAAVAAPFIEKLLETSKALDDEADKLDKAAQSADSFGNAQSLLSKIIDLTTGKLKTHNQVLIETVRLQAELGLLKGKQDEAEARKSIGGLGTPSILSRIGAGLAFQDTNGQVDLRQAVENEGAPLRALRDQVLGGDLGPSQIRERVDAMAKAGQLAGYTAAQIIELKRQLLTLPTALNDQKASQEALNAIDGKGVAGDLKPYVKPPKAKKAKTDTVTSRETEEIQRINEAFDETPSLVDRAAQATRKLDQIIADLSKRKPPGFERLLEDAERAKTVIQDGIQRPYKDFLTSQEDSLAVTRLILDGRQDEADALKIILSLQREMGPLLPEQKDAILATVDALRAEQHAVDVLHEKNSKYLEALGSVKAAITDVFVDPIKGIEKLPGRLLDTFKQLNAKFLFDKIFGAAFRELEDQVNGTSVVRDASTRMASSVDVASAAIRKLGQAAADASGQISGQPAPAPQSTPGEGDITVTGDPKKDPQVFLGGILGKIAEGIGIKPEAAKEIGKYAGKAVAGAATGDMVNSLDKSLGISKALGLKSSKTGAEIGGALGAVSGIPGGQFIGAALGSIVGGLFKSTKSGGATIGADGAISTSGNSAALKQAATGLAKNVQQGVAQIAQQLGGMVGNLSPITIGTYGKNNEYRVNTTGGTTLGGSKNAIAGVSYFASGDEGAAAALSFAIKTEIANGAVKGLSAAVQKALASSDDLDKAISEALKVQQTEELIGGIGYTLLKTFRTFDQNAAESLRVAQQYGLDVVATEKKIGEARTKLIADTLKASVGSLQSLVTSLDSGDLFEGSAVDKRNALLAQIAAIKPSAAAGDDGAADQLAALFNQLLTSDRSAFGTAGPELAADRALARSGAVDVITAAQARIDQASAVQQSQLDTLGQIADLTDETNDLLSRLNVNLDNFLSTAGAAGGSSFGGGAMVTDRFPNNFG